MPNDKASNKPEKLTNPEWYTTAAVDLITLSPGGILKNVVSALKNFNSSEYKTLRALYEDAFNETISQYGEGFSVSIPKNEPVDFENLDPAYPSYMRIFIILREAFKHQFREKYPDKNVFDIKWDNVLLAIRCDFAQKFEELRITRDKYRSVREYLEAFRREYSTPEGTCIKEMNRVIDDVENGPLSIDKDMTLRRVYITPKTWYWLNDVIEKNEEHRKERDNLIQGLLERLEDKSNNSPIVVHGEPGHGKTSSMKMLVSAFSGKQRKLEAAKPDTILFYEFKDLGDLSRDVYTILNKKDIDFLEYKFFKGRNTVLILDGLDERQAVDGRDNSLERFVRNLIRDAETLSEENGTSLKIVLTGRTQFVNTIHHCFGRRYHRFEIQDFTDEQVNRWLANYSEIKKRDTPLTQDDLTTLHLTDLMHQPILLTISAWLIADPEGARMVREQGEKTIRRGDIYAIILKFTFQKRWHQNPDCIGKLTEDEYINLLCAIAFFLLRNESRRIRIRELFEALNDSTTRTLLKLDDMPMISNEESFEGVCKNVGVNFFFRGLEDKCFEFIHKSFQDYLGIRGIMNYLFDTCKNMSGRGEQRFTNLANDIYFILAKCYLKGQDHGGFLEDMAASGIAKWEEMFSPLLEFFRPALSHRYMINGGRSDVHTPENPIQSEVYVLAGLLNIVTTLFRSFSEEKRKLYGDENGYLKLFEGWEDLYKLLHLFRAVHDDMWVVVKFKFAYIDLSGSYLAGVDLFRGNFCSAKLMNADLSNAYLRDARLIGAALMGADLMGANLNNADLRGAYVTAGQLVMVESLFGAVMDDELRDVVERVRPELFEEPL